LTLRFDKKYGSMDTDGLISAIDRIPNYRQFGRVTAVLGMLVEVGGWLSIHGPTEFTALILSGAAGLRLATAVLFAGREPRLARLARDGREAAVLMMGAVLLFVLAGLLEGLGRQLIDATVLRYAVGWTVFGGLVAYFCLAGRERAP